MLAIEEDQRQILAKTPLFIGRIEDGDALLWKPAFDMTVLRSTSAPVWVDLPNLNPTLKYFANDLLEVIGTVPLMSPLPM